MQPQSIYLANHSSNIILKPMNPNQKKKLESYIIIVMNKIAKKTNIFLFFSSCGVFINKSTDNHLLSAMLQNGFLSYR